MSKNKGVLWLKCLLLTIFLILSLQLSLAEIEVSITHKSITDTINPNGEAEFVLTVRSLENQVTDYIIEPVQQLGSWRITTPKPYIVTLDLNEEATSSIKIAPLRELGYGTYNFQVLVKDRKGNIVGEHTLPVKLTPFVKDSVVTEVLFIDETEPGSLTRVKVKLQNSYNYEIQNLKVVLKSPLFEQTRFVNLKANEKKIEEFSVELPNEAELGPYTATATVLSREGNLLGKKEQSFNVEAKVAVTERNLRDENFLYNTLTIVKENKGSKVSRERIIVKLSSVQNLFSSFTYPPDKMEKRADGYYATWNFELDPNEKVELKVTTDYRTFFYSSIAIILLIIITLKITSKTLIVSKRTMELKRDKGNISSLKVLLHIKNNAGKKLEKITIEDYLPSFLAITKHFGTLSPSKILKDSSNNTKIVWEIDKLESGEERIISYIAKSQLAISGRLAIPAAIVTYKTARGTGRASSNRLTLVSTPESE